MAFPPFSALPLRRPSTSSDIPPLINLKSSYILPIPKDFFSYTRPRSRIDRVDEILKEINTHAAALREQKSFLVERERRRLDMVRKEEEQTAESAAREQLEAEQQEGVRAQAQARRGSGSIAPINPNWIPLPGPAPPAVGGVMGPEQELALMMDKIYTPHNPANTHNIPTTQTDNEPVKGLMNPSSTPRERWEANVTALEAEFLLDSSRFEETIREVRRFYEEARERELKAAERP